MQRYLLWIDSISTWVGKTFAWTVLILTLITAYDVTVRKLFNKPWDCAFDSELILYGVLFMMAGAYTLARNGHVRGDVLYGFFPVRLQAGLDLVLYFLFFIPGVAALAYAGIGFAQDAWAAKETSSYSTCAAPVYLYKLVIPVAGFLVLLQGFAEIVRCVQALNSGQWPQRLHDVEEVDVEELKHTLGLDGAAGGKAEGVGGARQ
jgi:TRAP-type mannitol/chloroaromatic compound transport system permease small subunit